MYAYVYAVSMHGSMCTECIVSLRTAPVKVEDACSEERVPLSRELLTSLMWRCISNSTTKLVRYVGAVCIAMFILVHLASVVHGPVLWVCQA